MKTPNGARTMGVDSLNAYHLSADGGFEPLAPGPRAAAPQAGHIHDCGSGAVGAVDESVYSSRLPSSISSRDSSRRQKANGVNRIESLALAAVSKAGGSGHEDNFGAREHVACRETAPSCKPRASAAGCGPPAVEQLQGPPGFNGCWTILAASRRKQLERARCSLGQFVLSVRAAGWLHKLRAELRLRSACGCLPQFPLA